MHTMTELAITAETQQLINNLVEYEVQRTYGHNSQDDQDAARGARMIARAAIALDLYGQVDEQHRDKIAHRELTTRVREALEARRCQCHRIGKGGVCWHQSGTQCLGYFELDVPEIDGAKLCGTCYIATADERGLPMEQ